ncbi:Clade XVI lectin receptor kinase [Heracleum sosnowskyi]|uniref:non-specific serine/threonine protein kinase n=1 Tax=Heracleum sosnowskyi TaxID=360622 RepID=A0AAD8M4M0_9APIA|nr:Clade XVI lectin receptor kinase [Heracleum sosnowskyi]
MVAPPSLTVVTSFLLFFLYINVVYSQKFKHFSEIYGANPTFEEDVTHYNQLFALVNATISQNAIQLTPDTSGSGSLVIRQNRSGRALLPRKFKLWDGDLKSVNKTTKRIASFNSSFQINIYRPGDDPAAEGLAFVIAPDLNMPLHSYGQYLGLTNKSTDGDKNNKFVAVEFDTAKQDFDPDGNHVGLNLNSIKSVNTSSLSRFGIELAPIGLRLYNIWVNYDGVKKILEVYIANQTEESKDGPAPPMPKEPVMRQDLNLALYVEEYSYFGFSASTGNDTQLNCVRKWNLTVSYLADEEAPVLKIVLGVGIPVVVLLIVGVGFMVVYVKKQRKKKGSISSNILGALRSLPGTPREFKFRDLKKATNNFDDKFKLGQGGYGVVYRGVLPDDGNLEVAVKWFSRESLKGEDDFLAELTIINRLRHKHLVRLLGWCYKNEKLLLLYEYMPNGSLDMHLFSEPGKQPLSWTLRYKIVSGVASALHYLHNEYDVRVVHRDVKASNIMLDANFNARLGDFGLARALDNEKTSYMEAEGVLGTIGYIAPECFHTGRATQRSDVYAFGAVLIEVVCGQRPGTKIGGFQFLVDWVWFLHRDGRLLDAVDERLAGDYVAEEAERLLLLGLACSHPIAHERPKTQTIVQILLGNMPVPHVPPFKPSFVWPAMGPIEDDDLSLATTLDTTSMTSNLGSGWSTQNNEQSLV